MSEENDKLKKLLREAQQASEQANKGLGRAEARKDTGNIITEAKAVREGIGFLGRMVVLCKALARGIYTATKPVCDAAAGVGRWWKSKIWDRFAYKTNKETGERKISGLRAAGILTCTFAAVASITPTPVPVVGPAGDMVRDGINETLVLPALMATTGMKETIYASRDSQTSIDRLADTFQIRGSKELQTSDKNAVYYEVRPAFIHTMTQGALYNTRVVASAIPAGNVAKCEVYSYGFRSEFMLKMGFNPIIVTAKCDNTVAPASGVSNAAPAAPAAPGIG